jgi:hypothetical protein
MGRLRFSRHTPLISDSADELASVIAAESARTYDYLVGQRLVGISSPLTTLVLAHPAHFDTIRSQLHGSAASPLRFVDLAALGEACKLTSKPRDSRSTDLWLHLLVRHPPRDQFAPSDDRRSYRLARVGSGLRAAAIATLTISLGFAGASILQTRKDSLRGEELAAHIAIDERQLQQYVAALPTGPISTERLRALASQDRNLAQRSAAPELLLRRLAEMLTQVPDVQLERLTWRVTDKLSAVMADNKLPASAQGYVVIEALTTLPPHLLTDSAGLRSAADRLLKSVDGKDGVVAGTSDPRVAAGSSRALRGGTLPGTADPLHFGFWVVHGL